MADPVARFEAYYHTLDSYDRFGLTLIVGAGILLLLVLLALWFHTLLGGGDEAEVPEETAGSMPVPITLAGQPSKVVKLGPESGAQHPIPLDDMLLSAAAFGAISNFLHRAAQSRPTIDDLELIQGVVSREQNRLSKPDKHGRNSIPTFESYALYRHRNQAWELHIDDAEDDQTKVRLRDEMRHDHLRWQENTREWLTQIDDYLRVQTKTLQEQEDHRQKDAAHQHEVKRLTDASVEIAEKEEKRRRRLAKEKTKHRATQEELRHVQQEHAEEKEADQQEAERAAQEARQSQDERVRDLQSQLDKAQEAIVDLEDERDAPRTKRRRILDEGMAAVMDRTYAASEIDRLVASHAHDLEQQTPPISSEDIELECRQLQQRLGEVLRS